MAYNSKTNNPQNSAPVGREGKPLGPEQLQKRQAMSRGARGGSALDIANGAAREAEQRVVAPDPRGEIMRTPQPEPGELKLQVFQQLAEQSGVDQRELMSVASDPSDPRHESVMEALAQIDPNLAF